MCRRRGRPLGCSPSIPRREDPPDHQRLEVDRARRAHAAAGPRAPRTRPRAGAGLSRDAAAPRRRGRARPRVGFSAIARVGAGPGLPSLARPSRPPWTTARARSSWCRESGCAARSCASRTSSSTSTATSSVTSPSSCRRQAHRVPKGAGGPDGGWARLRGHGRGAVSLEWAEPRTGEPIQRPRAEPKAD